MKFLVIKCNERALYNALNDIDFISQENEEIIVEFEKLPKIYELIYTYKLISYQELQKIAINKKSVDVITYSLKIKDTYTILGYQLV